MKHIIPIYLGHMPKAGHYEFVKTMLEAAEACLAVTEQARPELQALRQAFDQEQAAMRVYRKDPLSDEIAQTDWKRGRLYRVFRNIVRRGLYMSMFPQQQADAKAVWEVIREHKIDPKMKLNLETGALERFIRQMEEKYAEEVERLNLTRIMAVMKEANGQVRQLVHQRNLKRTTRVVGLTKKVRRQTDQAYLRLVKMVNALALIHGEEGFAHFIDFANVTIVHFKREVLKQKAQMPKE